MSGKKKKSAKREFAKAAAYHPSFFPAEVGIDARKYYLGEPVSHAGVKFYAEQGSIHGARANIVPSGGQLTIEIDHWVHRPDGQNITTRFMEIHAEKGKDDAGNPAVFITRAVLQGADLNIGDRKILNSAVATCQQVVEQLRVDHSMPLLNNVAQKNGLKTKPLPETYKDGEVRHAYETGQTVTRKFLRVPEVFLPALAGFNKDGEAVTAEAPALSWAVQRDPSNPSKEYALRAQMEKTPGGADDAGNPTPQGTLVSLSLAAKEGKGDNTLAGHNVARLHFKPLTNPENIGLVELRAAEIDGRVLPLSDHKGMVRALHFVRDSALQAQASIMPDMAEIIGYTNLQKSISGLPPLSRKDGQRYTYRVLGGTPSGPRLFAQEDSIGATSWLHLYEWSDEKGEYKSEAGMVDSGILPLDRNKTGFDAMMNFAGDYFEHRTNQKHRPKHKVSALVVTHHHIDHYMGLPHMLLAGYVVDHVVCNAATRMYIEKECKALNVPAEYMPKKWTQLGGDTDLTIGKFNVSSGWIPHSAITNWVCVKTPEGSVFHYSDSKADPTVKSHPGPDLERIAAQKPTMTVVDSTRAFKDDEVRREEDIEEEAVKFLEEHPDKGAITFHIGSNAAHMVSIASAYGRTNRDAVVMGAAKIFLKHVLDKVGLRDGKGLKSYIKHEYGTDVVNYSPKAKGANAIINGPLGNQGIFATGTHNEIMSIVNRLIENKDQQKLGFITPQKYVVILAQTAIPGSQKGWLEVEEWLKRRGFEYKIVHASGHGGAKDIEKMLDWTKSPYGVATHGNNMQRAASEKIIKKKGMLAINPAEQDVIQISDKAGCRIVAQEPSVMVYYSVKRPDGQYYSSGEDVEYYAHTASPEIRTPVGEIIRDISRIKNSETRKGAAPHRQLSVRLGGDPVLNLEGARVKSSQARVQVSLPDYLIQNGILRRVVYDCETTQTGRFAWITQFAARRTSWTDDKDVQTINIRQTLPAHVLPDLEALLVTGVRPSELYKTGAAYYPPRQFYFETMKFFQDSRKLEPASRLWVDRAKPPEDPSAGCKNPASKSCDLDGYKKRSITYAFEKASCFEEPRAITVKALVGGFNSTRSDDMWLQHAGFRAGALRYSPTNTGGMRRFDLRNMARMYAYLCPDKFKTRRKPEDPADPEVGKLLDFTVKGVMEANNLGYDEHAHDAGVDIEMEDQKLLRFMLDRDPELFTQCLMNTNPKEIKTFLAGTHNGMLYPRHLLTYINSAAVEARANIGVYVGRSIDTVQRNKALIFNVSDFDPKDFEGLSAQQFAEIMSDPKHRLHKAFEIVQINRQPLLASLDRGMAVGANRGSSVETMKGAKHFIERNPAMAMEMIRGMEIARFTPDPSERIPLEDRIFAPEFMEMSAHDRDLAKLFEPSDEREFTDQKIANELNKRRAHALDDLHSTVVRERYVAVLYQIEREYEQLFGKKAKYLHPEDRAREKAKEKARVHGLIDTKTHVRDTGAISLGQLENQIRDARKNWDKIMEGKTPDQRAICAIILEETEALVQDVKMKIANTDKDWALTPHDYQLLGLDDNIPYGRYRPPLDPNPTRRPKSLALG